MQHSRRQFLGGVGSFAISYCASPYLAAQEKKGTRIILLGTKGGPRVGEAGRSNPSTLILINDIPYVVDCGYGVSRQLLAASVALNRLRYIFITHHHSDHNLEYGALFYNAWITGIPVQVMQNDDVKVSSCRVRHPPITQAYAYRFDAKDRSVVISGDTAYAPELAEFAKGADVLVHEIMYLPGIEKLIERLPNAKRLREHLMAAHTLPEDVGRIATQAAVKTLVLSHFVPCDDPSITDEQWSEGVRKYFKGRIIVGKDLMEI